MAKDSSFDVVSKVDRQEVDNALNQAKKEIQQRFDFKGTGAAIEWTGELTIEITANAEDRCAAALEVFKEKCVKRSVSLKAVHAKPVKPTGGGGFKIEIDVSQGIDTDRGRQIVKRVKDEKLKGVQVAIQGDQLRVSGKNKDDLQQVIQLLKDEDFGIPLQFVNYR
ncbi:MAG TPA: YajQ family cyclic di-GMP-binding protein [Actinomycetota bacterium]